MTRQCRGLVAALVCLALSTRAQADWEYTKWGMTPAQVIAASRGAVHLITPEHRLGPTRPDVETCAEGRFVDGRLHLKVSFSFARHGTELVLVNYLVEDAAQNNLLRDRLVHIYGMPAPSGDADMGSGIWRHAGHDVIDLSISDESPASVVQHPAETEPAASSTLKPKPPKS